jgi:NADH-quinone oxidoreductase subunit I
MIRLFVGQGVLTGMLVTLREFIGSYPLGRALLRGLGHHGGSGIFTIEYPERKQEHAERFRYFPFLVYDERPENLRCVACKICEQECPPQCIHIVGPAKDEQGRPLKAHGRTYPVEFDIDTSICMSCRICVDVCPFDAIEMDNKYELSARERFGEMVFNKAALLRSNEYFRQIKPTEAAAVDQRLEAKKPKPAAPAGGSPPAPPAAAP